MSLQESAEMYLETIYQLSLEQSCVRSVDVAEALGYSRASVSRAVGLLKKDSYLEMDKDGFLNLTELGQSTAKCIFERHTVLSAALMALGVDAESAAEDACRIEHVISDKSLRAIIAHMKKYEKGTRVNGAFCFFQKSLVGIPAAKNRIAPRTPMILQLFASTFFQC